MTGKNKIYYLVFVSLVLAVLAAAQPAFSADVRRFALIIGANDGGSDRVRLRYAETDAQSVARVLGELGGVPQEDRVLLLSPSTEQLNDRIETLRKEVAAAKTAGLRVEVFLYYSGHSDEEGLLMFGRKVEYREVRRMIDSLRADVQIIILDSCASGALTRVKGGKMRPAFMVDESSNVKGRALLTSSSANESAQESDKIGGSFFTHYLLSGMRGAADDSGDGRVTLNEAYAFAFNETLARTEKTRKGAQHPNYDIQLSGSGDLVMTDLRETSASLVISKEIGGRFYVRDEEGKLVVEVNKSAGREISLGLAPGTYKIIVDSDGKLSRAELKIPQNGRVALSSKDLRPVEKEATVARGDEPAETEAPAEEPAVARKEKSDADYHVVPFNIGLFPPATINDAYKDKPVLNKFSINVFGGSAARLRGMELSLGLNQRTEDMSGVQAAGIVNIVNERMSGVQFAFITNIDKQDAEGVQATGVYGYVKGDLTGAQVTGIVDLTKGNVKGVKAAGITSLTKGNVKGATGAGVFNYVKGDVTGAMVSYVANYGKGPIVGGQGAYIFNYAPKLDGAQLGLVNVTKGKVRGAQVGLVNYSEDIEGLPLGLVSIVKNGSMGFDYWVNDTAVSNLGFRLGSKYVYNLYYVGVQPIDGRAKGVAGLGIGGHIPIGRGFFESDILISHVFHFQKKDVPEYDATKDTSRSDTTDDVQEQENKDYNALFTWRFLGGYDISKRFSLFGGPSINVIAVGRENDIDGREVTWSSVTKGEGNVNAVNYSWLGLNLGLRYKIK